MKGCFRQVPRVRGPVFLKSTHSYITKSLAFGLIFSSISMSLSPPISASAGGARRSLAKHSMTTTIFRDDFDGTRLSNAWKEVVGANSNPVDGERECYSANNVFVRRGSLNELTLAGMVPGCTCPHGSGTLCAYVSGAVEWRSFSFTYGTIEVRARLAGGIGTWPAIWLLGTECRSPQWISSTCDWPAPGSNEIDIAEVVPSVPISDRYSINEQIHTINLGGARVDPSCHAIANTTNWHTYTLIWSPGSLIWKIDGITSCRVTEYVPSTPMFLIINTAVGRHGATVIKQSLPQSTQVSSVIVTEPLRGSK